MSATLSLFTNERSVQTCKAGHVLFEEGQPGTCAARLLDPRRRPEWSDTDREACLFSGHDVLAPAAPGAVVSPRPMPRGAVPGARFLLPIALRGA